jgi:hypothetical protein
MGNLRQQHREELKLPSQQLLLAKKERARESFLRSILKMKISTEQSSTSVEKDVKVTGKILPRSRMARMAHY